MAKKIKLEKVEKKVPKFLAVEWARQKGLPEVVFNGYPKQCTEEEFKEIAKSNLNTRKYKIE